MKSTIIYTGIFFTGLQIGIHHPLSDMAAISDVKTAVLYALIMLIGIGIGFDTASFSKLKKVKLSGLFVPLLVGTGSILGTGLVAICFPPVGFRSGLAVGSGFGFYSLSSVILTDLQGIRLGTIALITNMIREMFTILSTPLLARWFGHMAPIASAGANSMDITLPFIQRYSGKQYTMVAIFNGVILTILVPILVPIFGS